MNNGNTILGKGMPANPADSDVARCRKIRACLKSDSDRDNQSDRRSRRRGHRRRQHARRRAGRARGRCRPARPRRENFGGRALTADIGAMNGAAIPQRRMLAWTID
jgi:hypothetical protein